MAEEIDKLERELQELKLAFEKRANLEGTLQRIGYGTVATVFLAIVGGIFWLGNLNGKLEALSPGAIQKETKEAIAQIQLEKDASSLATKSDVNSLSASVSTLREKVEAETGQFGALLDLEGAVIAFDRDGGCPEGWPLFKPAISRTIIGAVAGRSARAPTKDENGNFLSAHQYRADGGAEARKLSFDEMPLHSHRTFLEYGKADLNGDGELYLVQAAGEAGNGLHSAFASEPSGGHETYNNMPPYIALYFCKKEG